MRTLSAVLTLLLLSACRQKSPPAVQAQASSDYGSVRSAEPAPAPAPKVSSCGNGRLDEGESCDDGNRVGGDGCSHDCRLEAVAFIASYVLDAEGNARPLPRSLNRTPWAEARFFITPEGATLIREDPPRVPFGRERGFQVPPTFSGRITLLSGAGANIVALDNGEIWEMIHHLDPATACRQRGLEEPGLLTPEGKRWCRRKWNGGRVRALEGEWVVDENGQTFYVDHKGAEKIELPPVKDVSLRGGPICVLLESGEVGCWGSSKKGEFGYMGRGPEGEEGWYIAEGPPKTFLRFPTAVRKLLGSSALTEGGEFWCWGDCGERPFADTGEPEPYWHRMIADDPPRPGGNLKPEGASTMPSAPLKLPKDCTPKDIADECVLCTNGCLKCWHDKESLESAECITY